MQILCGFQIIEGFKFFNRESDSQKVRQAKIIAERTTLKRIYDDNEEKLYSLNNNLENEKETTCELLSTDDD